MLLVTLCVKFWFPVILPAKNWSDMQVLLQKIEK
jgi:hypothetical protein